MEESMTQDLTASYAHALTDENTHVSLYPELARGYERALLHM